MSNELELQAKDVANTLARAGHVAYFAGGCVRDRLMGLEPADYDIATSATPGEVMRLFPHTVLVGAQFGVVRVIEAGRQFEVATFRADGAYLDGRHPEGVVFSSPETDALRRDFTINGMFIDPADGRVIDFVGGRDDLQAGVIRAIGDACQRMTEDHLRLLRALRFAARFDFRIEPLTWDAVVGLAGEIATVSAERIRDELVKMLVHPSRARALDLLRASGLLEIILPEVAALAGCEQPPQFHPEGDVFKHTRIMLDLLQPEPSVPLVLAVLLHDIGKPPTSRVDPDGRIRFNGHDRVGADMAEQILRRLKFSNRECELVVEAVRQHMVFKDVQNMRTAKLRRFMAREGFRDELELHRVDCTSSHGLLDNYEFLLEKEREFASEPIIPPPLLTGRDLIERGWKPSPRLGAALRAVQTRQLEGELTTRNQAIDFIAAVEVDPSLLEHDR